MQSASLALICFAALLANAQELGLPLSPVTRLPSPDGSKVLYGVPYEKSRSGGPELWIENTRTRQRTKLFDIGGTLTAAWSPDGTAFYVNNRWASDREQAYIYDAATVKRIDIGALILAADPAARQFANGHAYYEVEHWTDSRNVAVRFFGHTDLPPVTHFDFRYRVSRSGKVKRLSQETAPVRGG